MPPLWWWWTTSRPGRADNLDGRARGGAGGGVDPRRRPPGRGRPRRPRRGAPGGPGLGAALDREPRRHPRSERQEAPWPSSRPPGGRGGRRWWWRPRRRCTGPAAALPAREDLAPAPAEPLRGEQARHRGLRAGLRPVLRAARARVPVLQRVRPAAAGRPRLRRGGARLRGGGPGGRASARARRRRPDPRLHLSWGAWCGCWPKRCNATSPRRGRSTSPSGGGARCSN